MKTIRKILFLCGIIVFTACEKNGNADVFKPLEIKKITDFGCEDCYLSLRPEYIKDTYYVIYTENDFIKYVTGENMPSIDFEKYFLIIGTKSIEGGGSITGEKAEENNIEIKHTITITRDITHIAGTTLRYHAFIKKPTIKKTVHVEIIIEPLVEY